MESTPLFSPLATGALPLFFCFPLPWREGMKGRGREFVTFYKDIHMNLHKRRTV
jgi:hypothetical protein